MVICLERGAHLHMAQLMPLPLTVSCFSKIQIALPFWYGLTRVVPKKGPLNGRVCINRSFNAKYPLLCYRSSNDAVEQWPAESLCRTTWYDDSSWSKVTLMMCRIITGLTESLLCELSSLRVELCYWCDYCALRISVASIF